jgi:hypothetical protein
VSIFGWPKRGRDVPLTAAVLALLLAVVVGGIAARQWWHVRGWPVESARVDAMRPTGSMQHCGKYDNVDVYAITWVSKDPPSDLPRTFTSEEGCDAPQVGDVVPVVRVVNRDGSVHVWVDPATSGKQVAIVFGAVFGGVSVFLWVMFMMRIGWRRLRGHDDRPRHAASNAG